MQAARSGAFARFKSIKLDLQVWSVDEFEAEYGIQVLALSMRSLDDPDRKKCYFENADQLRENLTINERDRLVTEYNSFTDETNPDPDKLSPEVYTEIENYVKKKDGLSLSAFNSRILASFIIGMESQSAS